MRSLLFLLIVSTLQAATPLREPVGGADLSAWKGIGRGGEVGKNEASYKFPDGDRGWYQQGFRVSHDGSRNWRDRTGLRLKLTLPDDHALELGVRIRVPQPAFLKFAKTLAIRDTALDGRGEARAFLKSVEVIRGEVLAMDAEIRQVPEIAVPHQCTPDNL